MCEAAEAVRAAEERYKRLRTTVSLMRRDLAGLVDYGRSLRPDRAIWDQASDLCVLTARDLRRKLDFAELQQMESALSEALNAIRDLLEPVQSQDMSTNEVTNEQHYQNSNKDSYDFEPRLEKAQGEGSASDPATAVVAEGSTDVFLPQARRQSAPFRCRGGACYVLRSGWSSSSSSHGRDRQVRLRCQDATLVPARWLPSGCRPKGLPVLWEYAPRRSRVRSWRVFPAFLPIFHVCKVIEK